MNIIKRFDSLTSEDKANLCVVIVVFLKNSGNFFLPFLFTFKSSEFDL